MNRRALAIVFCCTLLGGYCQARELLTLKSGFTLEVSSHVVQDDILVAQAGTGTLQFPLAEIARIDIVAQVEPSRSSEAQLASVPDVSLQPEAILLRAAVSQGLLPELVRSVAKAESGLHPNAVSPKGAVGLMQLMPTTAAGLHVAAENPAENARGGATYLRQLLLQYGGNAAMALAAYNAGPGAVAHYKGIPPYAETRRYVLRVLTELAKEQRQSK